MSEDMRSLLAKTDKGVSEAENGPAKLFRLILLDLNVNILTWDRMMREYLTSRRSGIANNPTKRSSERSNLNRALAAPTVSWNQLRKALNVINPEKIVLHLDMTWDKNLVLPVDPPTHMEYEVVGRVNELHAIFQQLVTDMQMTPSLWSMLMERYLNDPRNEVSTNPAERSTVRGNRDKLLKGNRLTWSAFRTALSFLGVMEATFTIVLTHKTPKKPTMHSYTFFTGKSK